MFPLAIMLAVAAFRSDSSVWIYAMPLAVGGWLIAGFHTLLNAGIIPEAIEPCGVGPSCSSADMTIFMKQVDEFREVAPILLVADE